MAIKPVPMLVHRYYSTVRVHIILSMVSHRSGHMRICMCITKLGNNSIICHALGNNDLIKEHYVFH